MEHILVVVIAAVTGGGWLTSRFFNRLHELEGKLDRLPVEYVLKIDYIREMEKMNGAFDSINVKLDKLMESILQRRKDD